MPAERPPVPHPGHADEAGEQTLLPPTEDRDIDERRNDSPTARIHEAMDAFLDRFYAFDPEGMRYATGRVMEHSLSDGLSLLAHLPVADQEDGRAEYLADILVTPRGHGDPQNRIVQKHAAVFRSLADKLDALPRLKDDWTANKIKRIIADTLDGTNKNPSSKPSRNHEYEERALADIDAAYAELVRLQPPQRLRLKEGPKKDSDPALAAIEDAAHFAARISETLEGRYDGHAVHDIFFKRLAEADPEPEQISRWQDTFLWKEEEAKLRNQAIPMLTSQDLSALASIAYDSAPRIPFYGDLPWEEVEKKLFADMESARFKMPAELFYAERRMMLKKLEEATRELEARKRPRVLIESHEGPKEGWDQLTVDGSGSVVFLKERDGQAYLPEPRIYGSRGERLKTPDISGAILHPAGDRTWVFGYRGDAENKVLFSVRPDGTCADFSSGEENPSLRGIDISGSVSGNDFRIIVDGDNSREQPGKRFPPFDQRFAIFSAIHGKTFPIPSGAPFVHVSEQKGVGGKTLYACHGEDGEVRFLNFEDQGFLYPPEGISPEHVKGFIVTPTEQYTVHQVEGITRIFDSKRSLISKDLVDAVALRGSRIALDEETSFPERGNLRILDGTGRQVIDGSFPQGQVSAPFFFGEEIRALRKQPMNETTVVQVLREGHPPIETNIEIPVPEAARFYATNGLPFLVFPGPTSSARGKEAEGRRITIVGPDGQIAFSGAVIGLPTVTDFGLIIRPADAPGTIRVIRAIPGNTNPEVEAKLANAKEAKRILEELDETGLRNLADLWRKSRVDQNDKWRRKPVFPLHPAAGQILGRMAQDAPELYLKASPAVPDDDPEFLAERLVETLFPTPPAPPPPPPDIPKTSGARRILEGVLGIFRSGPGKASPEGAASPEIPRGAKAAAYLAPKSAAEMVGGSGRKEKGTSETVVECREPFVGFVANQIGGAYDRQADRWETIARPDRSHAPAHRVLTWAIPLAEWQPSIVLPLPPDARILPERIIAQVGKRQVPIPRIGPNDTVDLPPGTERVLYSFALPEPEPMADVSDAAFTQWKRRHVAEHPEATALQEVPGKIPPAISWILQSPEFKKLAPKEKVERIEAYVREISTYDTHNDEVSKRKEGVPLERQWAVAMERAKILDPNKPFAGVCADTAKLACALLRSVGFLAGVQQGFAAKGKQMTTEDAHATAFVLWPDADGKARMVPVDGTPSTNDPQAAEHPLAQIPEREAREIAAAHDAEKTFAQTVFAETKTALQTGNPEALKNLRNGKLEAALNAILAHEVRPSDLASVQALFSALRYSPLGQLDIADQAQRNHLQEELVETLDRQRRFKDDIKDVARPGRALFEEIRRFVAWTAKDARFAAPGAALAHAEKIVSLAKTGFNATERRALAASLLYLKAERMVASTD
jgi:hypothetical protein